MKLRSIHLFSILALSALAAQSPPARAFGAKGEYLAATRELPAGHELVLGDLVRLSDAGSFPLSALLPSREMESLYGARLVEPLAPFEPLRRWQTTASFTPTTWRDYCARLPRSSEQRKEEAPSYPRRISLDEGPVLAYARALPAGHELTARDLRPIEIAKELAGPYAIVPEALMSVVGRHLVAPVSALEPARYPALAEEVLEGRCSILSGALGNFYGETPPQGADASLCSGSQRLVGGIPFGARWRPPTPGWAGACTDAEGQRVGPFVAWHRDAKELHERGTFSNGQRSGFWQRFDKVGNPISERRYSGGRLTGTYLRLARVTELVHGQFDDDRMSGEWVFSHADGATALQARFSKGLPTGHWSWFDENGMELGGANFVRGALTSNWGATPALGERRAEVAYANGKRTLSPAGPDRCAPFGTQPFVEVLVAARELPRGYTLSARGLATDFETIAIPERLAAFFLTRAEAEKALGEPLDFTLPAGAILPKLAFTLDDGVSLAPLE